MLILSRISVFLGTLLFSVCCLAANPANWWIAITNDRVAQVQTLLAQGADPNEISPDGQPAIMQAIRDGAWKVFDLLAKDRRTVLNAINVNKETPLMYLAVVGQTARAQALINRGAMVNRLGWTPLQYAASTGKLDTVQMLVRNKAIVNAPAPDGTTALMMAARAGNEEVVRYLLDAGADVTMENLQKMDAADWARLKKHDELAAQLDALSARVMAGRKGASGAENHASEAQTYAKEHAHTQALPSASEIQTPPTVSSPGSAGTGNSGYFDLERFNKPAQP